MGVVEPSPAVVAAAELSLLAAEAGDSSAETALKALEHHPRRRPNVGPRYPSVDSSVAVAERRHLFSPPFASARVLWPLRQTVWATASAQRVREAVAAAAAACQVGAPAEATCCLGRLQVAPTFQVAVEVAAASR